MQWILPVRTETFRGEAGFHALRRLVEEQDRVTRVIKIQNPNQVMLERTTGMTSQQLRFNRDAFWQVCRAISGGLFTVLQSTWDEGMPAMSPADKQSGLLRAYNSLVQVRWHSLDGWRMVVDTQNRVIVGLVGKKYQFVSNHYVMSLVRSQMQQTGCNYQFVRGTQRNRDMMFTLANPQLLTASPGLNLRQGLAVVNSETTHRAIFFPRIVYDSTTSSYAMEPESKRNKMAHRKRRQFGELLRGLVETVFKNEIEGSKLCSVYRSMRTDVIQSSDPDLAKRVIDFATEYRISHEMATKIAMAITSSKSVPRTQWTVYEAFLRVADESAGFDRPLRQCAFRLLQRG